MHFYFVMRSVSYIRFVKLSTIVFVLYPFLNYYGYGNFTAAFLLSFILLIYSLNKFGKIPLEYPRYFLIYFVYFCVARLFCAVSFSDSFVFSYIFLFILFGFFNKILNLNYFISLYRYAAFVNIIMFLVQNIIYELLGYRIIGILNFLPLTNIGGAEFEVNEWVEKAQMIERSSGFFSEPAHFVQFLLPLLVLELFYVSTKKSYIRSLIYVLVLLLLSSGNAIVGLIVIGIFFFFYILKRIKPFFAIIVIFMLSFFLFFSVRYFLDTEIGKKLLERQNELDGTIENTSGFFRTFRGYYVWNAMNDTEKIFGLNSVDRIDETIRKSSVYFMFRENDRYFNAFQNIIIQTGLIGLVLFGFFILELWKYNNFAGRCCIAIYLALSFVASIYFSYVMLLYFILANLLRKENLKNLIPKNICNEKGLSDNNSLRK